MLCSSRGADAALFFRITYHTERGGSGQTATVSRVIYTLVGLAAIWCVSLLFRSEPDTIED